MSATRTYRPPLPKIPAGDDFRADPCGLRNPDPRPHTYGVRLSLRGSFATEPCRPTACIPAAPFRHTLCRFRPRQTTTVWRNLPQHPRSGETYSFSAKEKDSETGLSYFGSRYYSSDLSIWISVDPMSGKYPSTSPYAYCRNNPIILVDADGKKDRPFNPCKDRGVTYIPNTATYYEYVYDSKGRTIGYSIKNFISCYNCHSYAWNNACGSKNSKQINYLGLILSGDCVPWGINIRNNYAFILPRWNEDPTQDIIEQNARQMLPTENNQVGDRVIYYYDKNQNGMYDVYEYIVHSAIVEEVDPLGYTTLVKAKCGDGPISINHPDAPNYYNTYKDLEGVSHKTSRAYFRNPANKNKDYNQNEAIPKT